MKKIVGWVLFFVILMLFVSCGSQVTIALIVKDLNDPWFQTELKWANKAAEKNGFKLISYPKVAPSQETPYTIEGVMRDLDDAALKGVDGVIICSPDIYKGDQIVEFCKRNKMKLMSIDDRFKDSTTSSGFNEEVPHVGIDSFRTGRQVGITLAQLLLDQDWPITSIGVIELWDSNNLDIMDRIKGGSLLLKEVLPFKDNNFFRFILEKPTLDGAYNTIYYNWPAVRSKFKNWIVIGQNDDCVIGGIEALGKQGLDAKNILSVGINGDIRAMKALRGEFTGFMGTIQLNAKQHGSETATVMYDWIKQGIKPDRRIVTNGTLITRKDVIEAK